MARRKKAPPKKQQRPTIKSGPGRPSEYDLRRGKVIVEGIRNGLDLTTSARAAGITYETFRLWRNRGHADLDASLDTELARFFVAIKKAKAEGERDSAKLVKTAGKRTWQAAAWWLERVCHKRWGKKEYVNSQNQNANVSFTGGANGAMLPTKRELIDQLKQLIASMPDEELTTIESSAVLNGHTNGNGKH